MTFTDALSAIFNDGDSITRPIWHSGARAALDDGHFFGGSDAPDAGCRARQPLLKDLGKHKTGKGCLYVKRLADIDLDVLRQLVARSMKVHRGQQRASGAD